MPSDLSAEWLSIRTQGDALLDVHLRAAAIRLRRRVFGAALASGALVVLIVLLAVAVPSSQLSSQELRTAGEPAGGLIEDGVTSNGADASPTAAVGGTGGQRSSVSDGDTAAAEPLRDRAGGAPAARATRVPLLVDPRGDTDGDSTDPELASSTDLVRADLSLSGEYLVAELAVASLEVPAGSIRFKTIEVGAALGDTDITFGLQEWRGDSNTRLIIEARSRSEDWNRTSTEVVLEIDRQADVLRAKVPVVELNRMLGHLRNADPDLQVPDLKVGERWSSAWASLSAQRDMGQPVSGVVENGHTRGDSARTTESRIINHD